ncbi:hypothetical protein C9374_001891 [Naegleria lovaniensis]|uniref:Ras family small GTPase n=1 Tax=Naegleria lovaniensis TaxID=51637 RepID=A0AA88GVX6_NAELO|nr:uncharacterized protein C9374_001891 [Naegleria lovaniensis]KAG2386856.1 hypothetical protein C9374_001891 [Naegleria lovaniensis]
MGCGTFSKQSDFAVEDNRHTPSHHQNNQRRVDQVSSSQSSSPEEENHQQQEQPLASSKKSRKGSTLSKRGSSSKSFNHSNIPTIAEEEPVSEIYPFISWPEDIMISLANKGSQFEMGELSLNLSDTSEDSNERPLLKYVKEKRNSCQQSIIDCMYDMMSKSLFFGSNSPFPVNNENNYDIALDFIAQGCPSGKQKFSFFSHKEILLHRSAFFKGELSKDNGAVDSLKRTLSSAHDFRKSMVKVETNMAERRNTAGEAMALKRTTSHTSNQVPRSSLPPMPSAQQRSLNTASTKNLLAGLDSGGSSSMIKPIIQDEKEELFSSQGSLTSLMLSEEKRKGRKPNNQNLTIDLSKQTKSNLQASRLEVILTPLVKNPEVLLLVFENIYSGYFRPDYVHKMKSLDMESLIQVLALGYQFKVQSIRSVCKSLISQYVCTHKDKHTTLEDLISSTCTTLSLDDIQKNNMSIVLELRKIFQDSKKSLQENFISLTQEKRTFLKDLDFMFVHCNMKKNHQDFSDMKLTIHVEKKDDETDVPHDLGQASGVSALRSSLERKQNEDHDVQPLISQKKKRSKIQDTIEQNPTKKIFVHNFILKCRTALEHVEQFHLYCTNVDVVKTFVHYLYTDTVHNDAYNVSKKKIIPLAELFHIDRLKYECLAQALFNLNEDNILKKYRKAIECKEMLLSQAILYTMAGVYPKLVQKNFEEGTEEYNIFFSIDEKLKMLYQRISGQFVLRRRLFVETRLAELIPKVDTSLLPPNQTSAIHKIHIHVCGQRGVGVSTFISQARYQLNDLKSFEGVDNIELSVSQSYSSDKQYVATSPKADGVIFMFAVDNVNSYNAIRKCFEDFRSHFKAPVLVVGNKCDAVIQAFECENTIVNSNRLVKEVTEEMGCPYFEISARQTNNVKNCLEEAIREVLYHRHIIFKIHSHHSEKVIRDNMAEESKSPTK